MFSSRDHHNTLDKWRRYLSYSRTCTTC
ncbi:hypothetical protein Gorai_020106 [Gossypium raimondii]|uniref:Uncharacterized protein n=2 Tax=Gossypium TaxID=3633 RepID=A0A7J8PQF4_GOSRA|nr:hypothetical protein [Gossypium raimondii]MBA0687757.1 hypothetical protein [Gossypium aridum]